MTSRSPLLAMAVLLLAAAASAAELTRDDLKKVLDANPNLVLDVLRQNKKDFLDIALQAQQEEQARRQKEQQEAQVKELDERVKNPLKPEITKKTRIRGDAKAKYTLVEYSDFQCPFCGPKAPNGNLGGYKIAEALREKYGKDLRFIFKNKPLPFHAQARPAAQWLEAAALQSPEKAWAFHDKLFENQDKLGDAFYEETAKSLGLDADKIKKALQDQAIKDSIDADIKEAEALGFDGTPGFLLNGVPVRGAYPPEYFDQIIKKIDEAGKADKPAKADKAGNADKKH
ncbi:MAG: thioredoxin domain-containing protein [Elusimicrobia bacterium]|nr:thioredoxin domain-containing protein [Elusimicrobiota bacterium]